MISTNHLEGIAKCVHDDTGVSSPVDAFVLAAALGYTLKPGARATHDHARRIIRYVVKTRHERTSFDVLHECGHGLLIDDGIPDHEEADADYLASCLLLPRIDFLRHLRETDWDLFEMKRRHPNASHQAIAVRMCALSPAAVSIWDGGKWHASYGTPDTDSDRELANDVLGHGMPVRGRTSAYPLFDGAFRRVIVVRAA